MDFKSALKEVILQNGKGILQDTKKLNAYLQDLSPAANKETSILCQASQTHCFDALATCGANEINTSIKKAVALMKESYASDLVHTIEDALYYAFSLEKETPVSDDRKVIENTDKHVVSDNSTQIKSSISMWLPAALLISSHVIGRLNTVMSLSLFDGRITSPFIINILLETLNIAAVAAEVILITRHKHKTFAYVYLAITIVNLVPHLIIGSWYYRDILSLVTDVFLILFCLNIIKWWYLPSLLSLLILVLGLRTYWYVILDFNEYSVYYLFITLENVLSLSFLLTYCHAIKKERESATI